MSHGSVSSLMAILVLWLGCVAAGFCALQRYSAKAGAIYSSRDSEHFLAVHRQRNRPLLVMAIHPRCPCTNASLGELGDLLARSRGACDALLLQYVPDIPVSDWPADAKARRLGGHHVDVLPDRGGKIAAALGAATSGHVVFVDAAGAVRFTGGLTISRGHRGRSLAQDAILHVLGGASSTTVSAPVYGCALEPECSLPKA